MWFKDKFLFYYKSIQHYQLQTMSNDHKENISELIEYIKLHVDDLSEQGRRDILQMLINAGISEKYLQTKPGGTQVRLDYVPQPIIIMIHTHIQAKLQAKQDEIKHFPN